MKVLIIDDETDIGLVMAMEFKLEGHQCSVVESGFEAQKLIDGGEVFDAIVCDFQMPRMNGLEFYQWYKTKNISAPFYILTGEPTMDTQFLLDQGITAVLFKPQDINKLLQLIK